MTWDAAVPLASESLKLGDDRIRETATHLQDGLQNEKIFPGPNPLTAPVCYDKIPYGTTAARPSANASHAGRFYYNTSLGRIQYDNGGAWTNFTPPNNVFPSGSVIAWFQSAAPTGWSQLTDSAINDRALRVTSGGGAVTGGADSISSPPTHDHDAATGSESIAHTHPNTYVTYVGFLGASATTEPAITSLCATITDTSSSTAHTHTATEATAFSPAYADFLLAVKV